MHVKGPLLSFISQSEGRGCPGTGALGSYLFAICWVTFDWAPPVSGLQDPGPGIASRISRLQGSGRSLTGGILASPEWVLPEPPPKTRPSSNHERTSTQPRYRVKVRLPMASTPPPPRDAAPQTPVMASWALSQMEGREKLPS